MVTSSVDAKLLKIRQSKLKLEEQERELLLKLNREHIDSVVETIKKYSLSLEDIRAALEKGTSSAAKRKKTSDKQPKAKKDKLAVQPKYQNPNNPAEFWTSRGRPPLWAQALKEAGQLHTALIEKSQNS
jgi:DNA-binding protein H-NS